MSFCQGFLPEKCTCLKPEPKEVFYTSVDMCTGYRSVNGKGVKSLVKDQDNAVYESLLGNALSNKNLVVLENHCIIMRRDHKLMKGVVKLIGGGGAGIDPAEAYYVGKGMLTAAVLGELFTPPTVFEILTAIRELSVENPDGILLLVKNYIVDKINFGLALERALSEDINVKMLLIGDNAFESAESKHGKIGLAGAALVYKIVGEMAEQGKTMEDIIEECREKIISDLATVSVTYSSWNNIAFNPLGRLLGPQEMLLGLGVYGNQCSKKIQRINLKRTVSLVLNEIFRSLQLHPESSESSKSPEYEIIVLVNNLGALSKVEEGVIANEVYQQLKDMNARVVELLAGTFMTSKNPEGFSITILNVTSEDTVKYLNAPTTAPGWYKVTPETSGDDPPNDLPTVPPTLDHNSLNKPKTEDIYFGPCLPKSAVPAVKQILMFALEALISCEKQLNIIDSETGDGDIGSMLRKGAEAVKEALLNNQLDLACPGRLLFQMSEIYSETMSGIAGAMKTIFHSSASKIFQSAKEISPKVCSEAFSAGVKAIQHYGKAELGERTVLDVLIPVSESFETSIAHGRSFYDAVYLAATTCEFKSEEIKSLKSPILETMRVKQPLTYTDSGCHSVTISLRAVCEGLRLHYPTECD